MFAPEESLPSWFIRPELAQGLQPSLFSCPLEVALQRMQVSLDDVRHWRGKGWVTFDPSPESTVDEIADPRLLELGFVRDIARFGLPDAQVNYLLGLLPRPYRFDPRRIAFSFRFGWVEAVQPPVVEQDLEQQCDEWLDELATNRDVERLTELRERIEHLIEEAEASDGESAE